MLRPVDLATWELDSRTLLPRGHGTAGLSPRLCRNFRLSPRSSPKPTVDQADRLLIWPVGDSHAQRYSFSIPGSADIGTFSKWHSSQSIVGGRVSTPRVHDHAQVKGYVDNDCRKEGASFPNLLPSTPKLSWPGPRGSDIQLPVGGNAQHVMRPQECAPNGMFQLIPTYLLVLSRE